MGGLRTFGEIAIWSNREVWRQARSKAQAIEALEGYKKDIANGEVHPLGPYSRPMPRALWRS